MTSNDDERNALRAFDQEHALGAELLKAALDSAREAIRAMMLLNGGAAIALLGFLASTFSKDFNVTEARLYSAMLTTLCYFAGGGFAAVLTGALAYLANSLYAAASVKRKRQWDWPYIVDTDTSRRRYFWGLVLNWVAVVTGLASLVVFALGVVNLGSFILP